MHSPFTYDPLLAGAKGLVFIGDKLLVYRRDANTTLYPHYLDLPGGGAEANETPFETFKRELHEEFGLTINPADVTWWERYPTVLQPGKFGYMLAMHLPAETANSIAFGDEGEEWLLMEPEELMSRSDTWHVHIQRIERYLTAAQKGLAESA